MECGKIFDGKYRILKVLGTGGMGTVYMAQNIKLDTLWAIKEMNKRANTKIDILIEPNILKKLNHPSLPRIFDILEDEENIYIIADYIEGNSLDKELEIRGKFKENEVAEWAKQICEVFVYLHSFQPNPIIYRDMKPSNIILTKQGNIKLIDFGIAREYKQGSDSDTIYIGTRGYAAPEQYGCGQTSAVSDIYSLGMTLHHLLTGKSPNKPPFEIKPVRYYAKDLSEDIEMVVDRCIRVNPEERYASASELQQALQRVGLDESKRNGETRTPGQYLEKRYTSFKRLVLTVWDNAEFACEMAVAAAKTADIAVLLMDLDFLCPKVNFYMGFGGETFASTEESSGFQAVMGAMKNNRLDKKTFQRVSRKMPQSDALHVLSSSYDANRQESLSEMDIGQLVECAYKAFDLTVISVGKGVQDPAVQIGLEKSDYTIIASGANMDSLMEYQNYMDYMNREYNIPVEKVRFVAWEYKPGIHLPENLLKKVYGGHCYAGQIKYHVDREKSKNLEGMVYARIAWKKHREEYRNLLAGFRIVPARTFGEYVKDKTTGLFRKIGRGEADNE